MWPPLNLTCEVLQETIHPGFGIRADRDESHYVVGEETSLTW